MRIIVLTIGILICLSFTDISVAAKEAKNYEYYMDSWNKNIALASNYLKEAETSLKSGDAIEGCIKQKKAAEFGISATESLIKAFEISKTTSDLSNIKSGLNKWKELRDFC